MKVKTETWGKIRKKLDKVFGNYIKKRDNFTCFICGSTKLPQAGHYVSRTHMATRFSEMNVHVCCMRCNVFLHGNMIAYREKLVEKYGENAVKMLESYRNETCKLGKNELKLMVLHYQQELDKMGNI